MVRHAAKWYTGEKQEKGAVRMANVFEYLHWRGDLPFSAAPFNAADSLILCRLAYLPFDGLVPDAFGPGEALAAVAERMPGGEEAYRLPDDLRLLRALAGTRRFGGARLSGFVNRFDPAGEKQFAALTIQLEDEPPYIAFRGTDGTLVGWKEDFNMAASTSVPSQREAAAYLNAAADALAGSLRAGGHSKGGNLAVYAAAFCRAPVQARVAAVYSHDGPGFLPQIVESAAYRRIRGRVHAFIPQSSVVGMLLHHDEETTVVHSTNTFLLQHDLYSWDTQPHGLVAAQERTGSSRYIDATLKAWLLEMPPADRERLVDGVYGALRAAGAVTVADLRRPQIAAAALREVRAMDEPTRTVIRQGLSLLRGAAKNSLRGTNARIGAQHEREQGEE